jgi:single-stranded-DNA-specific exonuclease
MLQRGLDDPEALRAYFSPKLSQLHDPGLLFGCVQAAQRIAHAVGHKQRIVVYGDYDVDGMTAVAILDACLKMLNCKVDYYVPHRIDEGYGVNVQAIEQIAEAGTDLLITVDCGITAHEPLLRAKQLGMDVIVTDHHSPGAQMPEAEAIVHPALGDPTYPNTALCGAGVAFKLAWQTARTICGRNRVDAPMREFLLQATTLAALGTIADVVDLLGENRCLSVYGLKGLASTQHRGLRALLEAASLEGKGLDSYDVAFKLAPRLNACGRMGHARLAVELLTNPPRQRAVEIADYLSKQNLQRQKVERQVTAEAVEYIQRHGLDGPEHPVLVLGAEDWHGGVVGIVASRLVDRFAKPALVLSLNGDQPARGSGRSVPGFHMRDALAACEDLLENFGGHAMAGGVTLAPDRIDELREGLCHWARQHWASTPPEPTLDVHAQCTLGELNYPTVERIDRMAPFGQGNEHPVVALRRCRVLQPPRRIGRSGQTASLLLGQDGHRIRAVGFGMGDLADCLAGITEVDVAAQPLLNRFNGRTSVELRLLDVQW